MFRKLTLKNFRKHVDTTIDFSSGINVIRASNEAGKSSAIESCLYALFGTKTLRTSLDDTVTWNHDVKTLRVELEVEVGGEVYTFTRHKGGAEVIRNGKVFVTGQSEVSNFASTLLGADAGAAAKLFLASQGSIRGALEEGPKALSLLIESLASLDIFDTLLDAAQEKLALGSAATLEERLKGAQATLEATASALPEKPDYAAHDTAIAALQGSVIALEQRVPVLTEAVTKAKKVQDDYANDFLIWHDAVKAVKTAQGNVVEAEGAVRIHRAAAEKVAPDLEPLRSALTNAEQFDTRAKAWEKFKSLGDGPRIEGSAQDAEALRVSLDNKVSALRRDQRDVERELDAAKARRINHDKCEKCGQDVTHLEHVIATNTEVDTKVKELEARLTGYGTLIANEEAYKCNHDLVLAHAARVQSTQASLQGFITLDETVFPPKAEWVGGMFDSENSPNVDAARKALKDAEAEVKAVEQAKVRLALLYQQATKVIAELASAQEKLDAIPKCDPDEMLVLRAKVDDAESALNAARGEVILKQRDISALQTAFEHSVALWQGAQGRIVEAEKAVATIQKDIEDLGRNNALVKKLRSLRPLIADQLWNTVLASVSVMFSAMRKEDSWVTKTKDGFLVNGQAVESLSGSTLDLLGLALRSALLRTFLPNCSLLILDEVAAACDQERTEALLGFIAGAEFGQVILITHEDISESIADHIIEL